MKILLLSLFIGFCLIGYSQETTNTSQRTTEYKGSFVLQSVEYIMTVLAPADGELDDELEGGGSEMIETLEKLVVKENKIFWCYDCCALENITYRGSAEHVDIVYENAEARKLILKDISFAEKWTVNAEDFMGGNLLILDQNGKVLYKLTIEYEGCF